MTYRMIFDIVSVERRACVPSLEIWAKYLAFASLRSREVGLAGKESDSSDIFSSNV